MHFFLQILEHFSSTPTPPPPPPPSFPPPPPPLVLGQGSKVRGERSFPHESRGGGYGVGVMYMSSGVCFWIHFEFSEGVGKAGSRWSVSYIHTHTLQTRLVALC